MRKIIHNSHDMLYYISMLSTTGGKLKSYPKEIFKNYNIIKKVNRKKHSHISVLLIRPYHDSKKLMDLLWEASYAKVLRIH